MPLFNEDELNEELKQLAAGDAILPPVNVNEAADSFTVEVAIPGVKREELFIHAVKNMLSVSVMQSEEKTNTNNKFYLHEFNYHCFDRHIILPEDVDTSFARAEYFDGMLNMYVPKTKQPVRNAHTRIVVY